MFTDKGAGAMTEGRAQLLGGAPVALGYAQEDRGPAALALWRLAYAGWCWREVERGDPMRVRDAMLDAVHAAAVSGARGPNLTALAARHLATSGVELGLASPARDDEERVRCLAGAFTRMPQALRPPGLPLEQQRFAFRYGVALSDVERVRT